MPGRRAWLLVGVCCGWFWTGCTSSSASETERAADFERRVIEFCGATPVGDGLSERRRAALLGKTALFNDLAAASCLDWLDEHGCENEGPAGTLGELLFRLPGRCREAYIGTVAVGGPCMDDSECVDGASARCVFVREGEPERRCTERGAAGTPCWTAMQCFSTADNVAICAEQSQWRCDEVPPL